MKTSNVQYILRRIIVSSMNLMGQFSPRRPSIEGSRQTPKGELLMMIYAWVTVHIFIPTVWSWHPQHDQNIMWQLTTAKNIKKEKQKRKIYMYQTCKLVSESVLSKYPLCGKCYRTWLNLQSVIQSLHVLIYKDLEVLMIIFKCLNVLSERSTKHNTRRKQKLTNCFNLLVIEVLHKTS